MKIVMILPLMLLALAFLLGIARISRTLVFFVTWLGLCSVLYITSMMVGMYANPQVAMLGVVAAGLLALPSVWFATLFSIATSPEVSPSPIKQAYSAYQALDESDKKKVQQLTRTGASFATRHGATYLQSRGYNASADMLREASKAL